MSWRLRHEGSPQPVPTPLTPQQIIEGVKDGIYSGTDEVRGPGDERWQRLEVHPQFEEVVDQITESLEEIHHEKTDDHIDMNPLIDVCLVLLVFFILATTLSIMEKVLQLPKNQPPSDKPYVMKEEDAKQYIMLTLKKKGAGTIFDVNGYEAQNEDTLIRELESLVRSGKDQVILTVEPNVDFSAYTTAIDAATAARIKKIMTKATMGQKRNMPRPGGAAPAKAPGK
jgi:biopolymer transport protein ExbD